MNRKMLDAAFNQIGINAIISLSPQTRQWYTGIETSDGWLIIEKTKATLFVDGRYFEYAKENAKNTEVKLLDQDALKNFFEKAKFENIALESEYTTLTSRSKIKKLTNLGSTSILTIKGQDLRIVKSEEEILKLQKAVDISLKAFEKLSVYFNEGVTEKELDHKLNYILKRLGADKEGFDSIVAFGSNTSKPHHHPTDRKLVKGDIVTIDFGAKYQGYIADITRTFIFEDLLNPNVTDSKLREILAIVEEAARLGRAAVKPGIKASEVDKVCRDYIASKGYSKFFVHSTGHGIGLDVHEFPVISSTSETILEEGMVLTVEPGIYIEGIGGARIEDDVLVTKTGSKTLSRDEENNQ